MVGDVGVAPTGTGAPEGDRIAGRQRRLPRRARAGDRRQSCHYFWNFVRTFKRDDEELTKALTLGHVNDGKGIYDQDHRVLEAQQRAIEANPRQPFYNLNIDAGALVVAPQDRPDDRARARRRGGGVGRWRRLEWRPARVRGVDDLTPRHSRDRHRA